MRSLSVLLMFIALGTSGCWEKRVKHLSATEFDHYYALRPFMSEDQRKVYLKMQTEEERNGYLQELGLWDRFYKYSPEQREAIVAGDVQVGWTKDMALMAWGAPYDKQKLVGREATRSERIVYRFEQHEGGVLIVWEPNSKSEYKAERLIQRDLLMEDDVIVEIVQRDRWE